MSTAFDTTVLFKSLVAFLVKKGFLSQSDSPEGEFTPKAEQAYKSYAEHKCGVPHPQPVPANLEQVPAQILSDADWVYDGEVAVLQPMQEPVQVQEPVAVQAPALTPDGVIVAPPVADTQSQTIFEVNTQSAEKVVVQEDEIPAADSGVVDPSQGNPFFSITGSDTGETA